MDINVIMQQINLLLQENEVAKAEEAFLDGLAQAMSEDTGVALQLLNELLGFYRETGQTEKSYKTAKQAMDLAEKMGISGTVPYATTLQNVANAYRAGGRLADSLKAYKEAAEIYEKTLSCDDMLVAGLHNNLSLLYQEMEEFAKAKEELRKALQVVEKKEALFEIAATYTNLAGTCLQLGEQEEAFSYAREAVERFEALQQEGTHYCGALTALGSCYFEQKEYGQALEVFHRALDIMYKKKERTRFYERLQERIQACEEAMHMKGLTLCRRYYETYGAPMIAEKFPAYRNRIAVGLVGEGSDCFGYDDAYSADHDFGPGFCMWVSDETYEEIGEQLQQAYEQLPVTFEGYTRRESSYGRGRRGVCRIKDFYVRLLGTDCPEQINWQQVSDSALAAAVSGEVFRDEEGLFTDIRKKLQQGYPLQVRYLRMAQAAAEFAQCAQYNFPRMSKRGAFVTAEMMRSDGIKAAMKLQHYLENRYPIHDKWLYRSIQKSEQGCGMARMIEGILSGEKKDWEKVSRDLDALGSYLVQELYRTGFISDIDTYLDAHAPELIFKASAAADTVETLVDKITSIEFEAFDKVQNVGGRASCQNDRYTFAIMRKSQYLTWNHMMLLQYFYDFSREYAQGHNLIEEKYGRMMESTAPAEYEAMKEYFPILSPEKQAIIQQIVQMQVAWMEEFAEQYPALADRARSIRSTEDHLYNTSYETYLRGEISTYSDKMLELYGRYVVEYARAGRNPAYEIMRHTAGLYGYEGLDAAEAGLKRNEQKCVLLMNNEKEDLK